MAEKTELEKRLEKRLEEMIENKIKGVGKLPSVTPEVEKAQIELSDDELDKAIKESVKPSSSSGTAPDKYICGGCGYESEKEFNPCPNCGNKLKW